MSLLNQNTKEGRTLRRVRSLRDTTDFAKVGGLRYHLKVLREVIILPLLHGNVFSHFKIKAPKGVLFYGPPGTGKTLVAGALASEINKEGIGKVSFFQRKGADVLTKWVGESEKNLRALFEKATKCRPSIIFFDELDGLAPVRSEKNDHIHSSIVATLLALMDGLDAKSGVIVIGATNRIDAIDPALRRPGRFDRELYFPLPGIEARKEIIQVHVSPWKYKPSSKFVEHLADITTGFSGSDLQALCSEAVLCCLRRMYPKVETKGCKIKIEAETLMIEECDFLEARMNIVPSSMKQGQKVRSLNHIIRPLLIRQQTRILRYIRLLWPHFLQEDFRYVVGDKRYAGRIVIIGSNMQGLNSHLMPSILKYLEHLPCFVYDVRAFDRLTTNLVKIQYGFPAVVLLSRIDEWWNSIESCDQQSFASSLEDIHANLPIFIIATCENEVPEKLHHFFYNNSTILIRIEDPNEEEREHFLAPLFFEEKNLSLYKVWESVRNSGKRLIKSEPNDRKFEASTSHRKKRRLRRNTTILDTISSTIIKPISETELSTDCAKTTKRKRGQSNHALIKRIKLCEGKFGIWRSKSAHSVYDVRRSIECDPRGGGSRYSFASLSSIHCLKNRTYFTGILSDIVRQKHISNDCARATLSPLRLCENLVRYDPKDETADSGSKACTSKRNPDDRSMKKIYSLWKHASLVTSKNMTVVQLELLYDVISACISIHQSSFGNLVQSLDNALKKIENSYHVSDNTS